MQNALIVAGALVILAGAFPDHARQVIAWAAGVIQQVSGTVTPDQQLAIFVAVVLLALYNGRGR